MGQRQARMLTMRARGILPGSVVLTLLAGACTPTPTTAPSPRPSASVATPTAVPSHPPTIAPTELPTPSPTRPPASTIFTDWTLKPLPIAVSGVYGGNTPADVVGYGGGYVAVGGINGGCCDGGFSEETRALVWRSRDGSAWRLIPNAGAFRYGRMNAVAVKADLLVAVGHRNLDGVGIVGAVWTSADASTWSLVRDVPEFADVAATPTGFVAVANADVGSVTMWQSTDGRDWRRIATGELGSGRAHRLIALDDGYLMVGIDVQQGHGQTTTSGSIWRSAGGTTWERVPPQSSLDGLSIDDSAKIGDVYVAIGTSDTEEDGVLLTSADGLAWARTAASFSASGTTLDRVISVSGALIVTGWAPRLDGSWFRAWTSTDGRAWAEVPANDATAGGGVDIDGWVATGDGFLAVGRSPREGEIIGPAAWLVH